MATTKVEIEWPKNYVATGILSFPLCSDEDIAALAEWRVKRGIKKPKFADKIGGSLLLNQEQYDKARAYLTDTYLPFVDTLYKDTDGAKGISPELVAELLKQAKAEDWSKSNMPIRNLTDKDIENAPDGIVYKLKFSGPYEASITKKALIKPDPNGPLQAINISEVEGLPENRKDEDTLWWGANWHFRTSLRFNAFDTASVGVSAYCAGTLYLLPHLGMPITGGGDAAVLEDGDDWESD